MTRPSRHDAADPLPRDWLPAPAAPPDAAEWQVRLARIVTAADPAMRRLGAAAAGQSWPGVLGAWWKPAAALAAAAAALLLLLEPPPTYQQPDRGWVPLSVMAAEGEPFALWNGLGIDADPVLAWIVLVEPTR